MSSSRRSRIVWSRRAPMFSSARLTCSASRAISPLASLAGDIGSPAAGLASRDLVDLVQEDDPRRLRAFDGLPGDLSRIDEAPFLLRLQDLPRLADGRLAPLLLSAEEARKHLLDV